MEISKKITWLVLLLVVLFGALFAQVILVTEVDFSNSRHTGNSGELLTGSLAGQTMVAERDNLSSIGVVFATYSGRDNTGDVEFHLRTSVGSKEDLRSGVVSAKSLGDNQLHRFSFDKIPDSKGKTYFFFLTSSNSSKGDAITIDIDNRDVYNQGSAYLVTGSVGREFDTDLLNKSGKEKVDLSFATYYSVPAREFLVNKSRAFVNEIKVTWNDRRSLYGIWSRSFLAAVLFIGVLLWRKRLAAMPTAINLSALVVVAIIIRVIYAVELPVTNDEGNYLYDARTLLEGRLAGGDGYVKAPLVVAWVALWEFFGNSVLFGRLSSVVIGSLTLLPLYVLGRDLWGKKAGLLAAAAWSLFGVTTVFNIYVHTQPLAVFFGISGLAVLIMSLKGSDMLARMTPAPTLPLLPYWFISAGALLGLGVSSRKSILAIGLVPLVMIFASKSSLKVKLKQLLLVGLGFVIILALFLTYASYVYGVEGFWEAIGFNSAEDGINAVTVDEIDQVRAYSIRGMTPFFRESLPLILLSIIGFGLAVEKFLSSVISPRLAKLGWVFPLATFWWAWGFFSEYEGTSAMIFNMEQLWYWMAAVILSAILLPTFIRRVEHVKGDFLMAALVAPVWILGLVFFYTNWIKFHANYIGEFLPALVLMSGIGAVVFWEKAKRWPKGISFIGRSLFLVVLVWALFTSGVVTFLNEHTGTFQQGAIKEAAAWARENIPSDESIFTGAAVVPYLSGHHTALDIAHPRWYAYEFTRKDTERINTFLPSAEEMVQAFRDTEWFLLDKQTGFSFLMEYSEIESGLETDFESVKGISNGSNTLTFYRRVK